MERFCCECRWFRDAQMHRTYKTPCCTQRGRDDDCAYMRQNVCGIEEAILWQPTTAEAQAPEATTHAGVRPEKAI